jgi:protein-disulfide isomerase
MTDKEVPAQAGKTLSSILVDVRNGVLILAGLAFAFHWATQDSGVEKKAAIEVGAIELPSAQPAKPAAEPKVNMEAKALADLIKARAAEVSASGSVILKTSVQASNPPPQGIHAQAPVFNATSVLPSASSAQKHDGQKPMSLGVKPDGSEMNPQEKAAQIKSLMAALPNNYTINWVAANEQTSIYVFSDPTCGYCRKLHKSIGELNAAGITVKYLMYPRDLPSSNDQSLSPTAKNLNNIWCSADQKQAFNDAFDGYRIAEANCADLPAELNRIESPMRDHYFLGTLFDIRGTPTIITSDGIKIEGFGTASELINRITNK